MLEYISKFFQSLVRRNLSMGSLVQYFHALKRFFLFFKSLGMSRLEFVDREHLGAFIEYLQDDNLMSSSINSYLRSLYAIFGFLAERNVISSDIMKNKFRLKMPDILPKAIDPDDLKLFLSVINTARERALILVLLRTGMRIGELLGTKIIDIDFSEKKIEIPQAQKTYEGRIVYMGDDACSALKNWLKERLPGKEYIFYGSGNREKLSYPMARVLFVKHMQKAGLSHKGYTLHCLRHTFASELLNAGMRLECLQVLLGHKDIEMTRRYARLTDITRKHEYFKAMEIIEKGEIDGHYRFLN
ncbi:tyrosine-type recombinase/integrase [Desulfobacula sp.]|uniref:tyrosine-type recombinase/integrase n=1 Tax=Desulfobacula sp. TaxID=2593537 RepID=UPI0025BC3942|nr:tyrosine-type recombinase/integrase [Desulfobacula sp.]MBC2703515.1 tyrosine-type recombinase/integrase [Desulfobacula sp.]